MWATGNGERLMVAATLEPVEQGQEFETMPPHMAVIGWMAVQTYQRHWMYSAMDRIFEDNDVYQDVVGAGRVKAGPDGTAPGRLLRNADPGPWFGFRGLARSLSALPADNPFEQGFTAQVANTPERTVRRGEHLALPTVAAFTTLGPETGFSVTHVTPIGEQRAA